MIKKEVFQKTCGKPHFFAGIADYPLHFQAAAFIVLFFPDTRRMKKHIIITFFLLAALGLPSLSAADGDVRDAQGNLMRDLLIVDYWNRQLDERMPVTFNHLLTGGYFNMPSARMGAEGEIGVGYSWVPPYNNYGLRLQLTDRLEVSGDYRVFTGVKDPVLSQYGFGDLSDKGANIKLSLFQPEDSHYHLPGLAIGTEDFLGTRSFAAKYAVLTQVIPSYDTEITLGYGTQRIKKWFGGMLWMPFRKSCNDYLKGISIAAEYDAIPYKDEQIEPHPKGRKKRSPINFGAKYRLWDRFDFSASYVRGHAWAFSTSTFYNFGYTKGLLPKIDDTLPYKAPVNRQELGCLRPEDVMMQDLLYAFREQGFEILDARLSYTKCQEKLLRMTVMNDRYRQELEVRNRLSDLLAALIPTDIDKVSIVIDDEGYPIQEYHFEMYYVREYGDRELGPHELKILSPLVDVGFPDKSESLELFRTRRDLWNFEVSPKTHTFFGSAKGKFKYSFGVYAGFWGYIMNDVYYSFLLGYNAISNLEDLQDMDRLNPSQLIEVHTDIVNYYKVKQITINEMYLQKVWNLGKGCFTKLSGGYYDEMYGGFATEFLYYPVSANWAIGFEGAVLKKRHTTGLGFSNRIRKLKGFIPTYPKFLGSQGFVNLYYDWTKAKVEFKFKIGKFLANDCGIRYELSRYFPSGLRITLWYTYTNGNDKINGQTYHDKGVAFEMPMDIFYTHSSREKWNYGLSAWLRDVGFATFTGHELYYTISDQRK